MTIQNNNLYAKCSFSNEQLTALQQLYAKYFEPKMPQGYQGTGVAAFWEKDREYPTAKDLEFDPQTTVRGFAVEEAAKDPLWNAFEDLLPYMALSAIITEMPPLNSMVPHVDRAWRSEAIYFPIKGCTKDCVSIYYENGKEIGRFAVHENAYLNNVHKMHGVVNKSNKTRVAFGWNFKSPEMTFNDCYDILSKLGYLDTNNSQG